MNKVLVLLILLLACKPSYASYGECAFDDCGSSGLKLTDSGWSLIAGSPSTLASGDTEVTDMVVHKGEIYVGYYDNGSGTKSAQIYKWNGQRLQFVYSFGTGTAFSNVASLAEYKGDLYAGIQGASNGHGDVYVSTDDGVSWTKTLDEATAKFSYSMAVFKGSLYVGQGFSASVIKAFDGSSWTTAYSGLVCTSCNLVNDLEVYDGRIFAGIGNGGAFGGIVSSIDGTTWVQELSSVSVFRLQEFRGKLYATAIGINPAPLYVRDDSAKTWSQVTTFSGSSQCDAMGVYNDSFYVGCTVTGGGIIYKSYNGTTFATDFTNTTQGAAGTEPFRMINYQGALVTGFGFTENSSATLWKKLDSIGNIIDRNSSITDRFRYNTNNSYTYYGNDKSLLSVSTPVSFDNNISATSNIGTTNNVVTGTFSNYASTSSVVIGVAGDVTNTGSETAGTGHLIGTWGRAMDNASGNHFLIGSEGKVEGRSNNAITYYGGVSYALWQGAGTNASTLIGHTIQREITTDGSTPKAQGTSYGLYIKDVIGSANNFGAYIEDQTGGTVDVGLAIGGADTAAVWLGTGADNTDAANGIYFGASLDTNLYRGAASTLKTDGELRVGGISGDGSGKVVCVNASGNLGTCSSAVGAGGTCTCS